MIHNTEPHGDYPLIYTAIINEKKRLSNITYLLNKWQLENVPPEYREKIVVKTNEYINNLSKINEYKVFDYFMWGKIIVGLENFLDEAVKFWKVCEILDE